MNDSDHANSSDLGYLLAALLLRIWLSMRAIQAGLEKFAGVSSGSADVLIDGAPNAYGLTEGTATKAYSIANYQGVPAALTDKFASEPLIPAWGLDLYNIILGPAFILLGLALLLGLASRFALFGMGLLYTSLTFGLILIKQSDGVAWLGIHILMVVTALLLSKYNRFTLLKKW